MRQYLSLSNQVRKASGLAPEGQLTFRTSFLIQVYGNLMWTSLKFSQPFVCEHTASTEREFIVQPL